MMEQMCLDRYIASHTNSWPFIQGTTVTVVLSGYLPSDKPAGSSLDGTRAAVRAQWMISLMAEWW